VDGAVKGAIFLFNCGGETWPSQNPFSYQYTRPQALGLAWVNF
jgi:hypothetical protein